MSISLKKILMDSTGVFGDDSPETEGPSRSTSISKEQFLKHLQSSPMRSLDNLKKLAAGHHVPMRGKLDGDADYYIVSPAASTRYTRNSYNYYMLIIDNSPEWKDYPKRSQSLICGEGYEEAYGFGGQNEKLGGLPNVFAIIPMESNAKFGICPSEDIWNSFETTLGKSSLDDFNDDIRTLLYKAAAKLQIEVPEIEVQKDWKVLQKYLSIFDSKKAWLKKNYDDKHLQIKYTGKWFQDWLNSSESIISALRNVLSPKANGFKVINYYKGYKEINGSSSDAREVWTDSQCLMVRIEVLQEMFNMHVPGWQPPQEEKL